MTEPAGQQQRGARRIAMVVAAIVVPLMCALGVLGGIGSFATVRHLARPWFGASAWTVPAGIDAGILALLAWDLLTEYLGLSWPPMRWTAWTFVAATTYLNIAAARGTMTAAVMHAAMPILFVTVIDGIRHLIRQYTGLAAGTRIEHIPAARWLLAPHSTFLLARRMILWHLTSYRDGLRLEYQRLAAIARLQQAYGRWLWRWRAPLADRLALRLTITEIMAERPAELLAPATPTAPISERDQRLITIAASILRDADQRGIRLSQAKLARQIRARGLAIPNDRLAWLATAAQATPPETRPESAPRGTPWPGPMNC